MADSTWVPELEQTHILGKVSRFHELCVFRRLLGEVCAVAAAILDRFSGTSRGFFLNPKLDTCSDEKKLFYISFRYPIPLVHSFIHGSHSVCTYPAPIISHRLFLFLADPTIKRFWGCFLFWPVGLRFSALGAHSPPPSFVLFFFT